MGGQYRENWKRLAGKNQAGNVSSEPKDLVLYSDLTDVVATTGLVFDSVQFNTAPSEPAHSEGLAYWNNADRTLNLMTDVEGTIIQVGQESVVRVVNKTGTTLLNGEVVYVDGAQGNRATVNRALATSHDVTERVIGLATNDILNNQNGYITTFGQVRDLDTSAFSEGDSIWLSATTSGALTNIRPSAPFHAVFIGFCTRSHNNKGVVLARINVGNEIHDLHDVILDGQQDGDLLAWNGPSGYWENKQIIFANTSGISNTGRVLQGGTYSSSTLINLTTDDYLTVITGSGVTINLPALPLDWETHLIKDGAGHASSQNFTINGNGNTIDGQVSLSGTIDYESFTLVFNTTEWSVL